MEPQDNDETNHPEFQNLKDEEKVLFKELRDHLSEHEKTWCTAATYCRFLRARAWDVDAAFDQLKSALVWRFEYKPHMVTADDVKSERENEGKMYRNGYDKLQQPILYMKPGKDNTSGSDKKDIKVKNLIYMMEKCARAANGKEKLLLIIDFKDHSQLKDMANMSTNMEVLNVLQNYYPESLYKALIYNSPWSLSIFWNMISPFLEDVTRQKIVFVKSKSEFLEHVEEDQLEASYGGKLKFVYSFEEHWNKDDIEFPPPVQK